MLGNHEEICDAQPFKVVIEKKKIGVIARGQPFTFGAVRPIKHFVFENGL
jgi:hypothetical protein